MTARIISQAQIIAAAKAAAKVGMVAEVKIGEAVIRLINRDDPQDKRPIEPVFLDYLIQANGGNQDKRPANINGDPTTQCAAEISHASAIALKRASPLPQIAHRLLCS